MIRLVVVVGLGAATFAHADPAPPPDPAVDEAADANLESTASRQGLTATFLVGGSQIVGFGISGSAARGGSVNLRVGHVATPHTVITFELGSTVTLHGERGGPTEANTNTNLLAGGQYYVNPSLWLRFSGGVGAFQGRSVRRPDGMLGDVTLIGPTALAGIGLEVVRFRWAALGIELATSATANREGVLVVGGLEAGLTLD
jgi:hypothetical protein